MLGVRPENLHYPPLHSHPGLWIQVVSRTLLAKPWHTSSLRNAKGRAHEPEPAVNGVVSFHYISNQPHHPSVL